MLIKLYITRTVAADGVSLSHVYMLSVTQESFSLPHKKNAMKEESNYRKQASYGVDLFLGPTILKR